LMCILLQQNDVFILDEPFNGVDIQSNILISEVINKLMAKGKTILISSHIFSTLTDHCDTIHLLKDGVIQKSVLPESYRLLEEEMKSMIVGNKMKDIDL